MKTSVWIVTSAFTLKNPDTIINRYYEHGLIGIMKWGSSRLAQGLKSKKCKDNWNCLLPANNDLCRKVSQFQLKPAHKA